MLHKYKINMNYHLTFSGFYKNIEGVDKLMTSRHLCAIRLHERKTAMP